MCRTCVVQYSAPGPLCCQPTHPFICVTCHVLRAVTSTYLSLCVCVPATASLVLYPLTGGHSLLGRRSVVGTSVSKVSSLSKSNTNAVRRGRYMSRTFVREGSKSVEYTERARGVEMRMSERLAPEAVLAFTAARTCGQDGTMSCVAKRGERQSVSLVSLV